MIADTIFISLQLYLLNQRQSNLRNRLQVITSKTSTQLISCLILLAAMQSKLQDTVWVSSELWMFMK